MSGPAVENGRPGIAERVCALALENSEIQMEAARTEEAMRRIVCSGTTTSFYGTLIPAAELEESQKVQVGTAPERRIIPILISRY
jgi:hypothetical protein